MVNSEAEVWSTRILGSAGPRVREELPGVLIDTHNRCVALQSASELPAAYPYGLMWIMLPNAVVKTLGPLAGSEVFRPRNGKYPVVAFNGVPVLPWRISKDQVSQLDDTALADPVTGTKRALFERRAVQPMLFSEDPPCESETSDQAKTADLRDMIDELVGDEAHVALLAYSSNQHALLSAYFGYAKLGENDVVELTYWEKIDLEDATAQRLRLVRDFDGSDSFDAGDLGELDLRPRTPLEGIPSFERPIELPGTAEDEND